MNDAEIMANKLISRAEVIPAAIATCTLTNEEGKRIPKIHFAYYPTMVTLFQKKSPPYLGPIMQALEKELTEDTPYDQDFLDSLIALMLVVTIVQR